MDCTDLRTMLHPYLDGELEQAVKQDLERHLELCGECKMVVDQTKLTVNVFCDSKPVELPADVQSRLHEALRRKFAEKTN